MKHRIFVALGISEKLISVILNWEDIFASESHETYSKIRWLKPENLHITLIPPWYAEDEEIETIKKSLSGLVKKNLILNFNRITYGPNPKSSRLIWLEGEATRGLSNLRDEVSQLLDQPVERRPFLLHLTVARFKEGDFNSFKVKELNDKLVFEEMANKLLLMESHLERGGAEYSILHQIDL